MNIRGYVYGAQILLLSLAQGAGTKDKPELPNPGGSKDK